MQLAMCCSLSFWCCLKKDIIYSYSGERWSTYQNNVVQVFQVHVQAKKKAKKNLYACRLIKLRFMGIVVFLASAPRVASLVKLKLFRKKYLVK